VDLQRLRDEWRGAKPTREFVEHASAQLDAVEEFLPEPPPKKSAPPAPGEKIPFGIGDRVRITTLGQTGSLVGLDDESAEVQIGAFRMRVAREELERVEAAEPRREAAVKVPEVESPGMELHLRGLRADDALVKLEDYLDRAYLAGLPQVRIVHGKGTGALRKLVREALAEHPLVAEVKQVEESEGGEGVTVARLVSR
jgi:DNA mismatch repair protein MutS2